MFGMLETSTSGLVAQRIRMDTIAGNVANADVPGYHRRVAVFTEAAAGVEVQAILVDPRPGQMRYDPGHPQALAKGPQRGYVQMSNVSVMNEMVNAIEAARAYDANVTMMNATKAMAEAAIRLIA